MKRFLSILLSVMLLLGSLTVTVFAAPELSLVATNQLANINSAPFADAGKYVLFNKVDGAAYYVNGEEATVDNGLRIDTPLNKADFVALKVANAGPNVFTAVVDGVASNSVNVYGLQTIAGTMETSSTRFTSIDVDAIEDADLKEALSQRENVGYFPAYSTTTGVNGTTISQNPASSSAGYTYDGSSTNSKSGINLANMQAYRTSTSVYINDTTISDSYIGLFDPYASGHSYTRILKNGLGIYVNYTSSTTASYSTGFNASYNAWNDFEMVVYEYTLSSGTVVAKPDLYFNNILIAKQINKNLSGSWGQYVYHNGNTISGGNVYHTKVNLSNKSDLDTIPYYPALTAVADEENDKVIVTGTDVDEFIASQYAAKVFVNGAPTEDAVVINAEGENEPTSISVPEALTNATVYVAFVDENNNVLNGIEPVKTAELTFESIAANANAYNPSISATIDEAADTITVFGKDLEEYDSYTAKIFVNGTATEDEVTVNAEGEASPVATHITSLEALTDASVYVALVDAEGNIAQGLTGELKTETFTFASIAPTDIMAPLAFSVHQTNTIETANNLTVLAGSKVLFDAITLTEYQAGTVKYFHNGTEVTNLTSSVANTVALPVSAGTNTYYAQRFINDALVEATKSNVITIKGVDVDANGVSMNVKAYLNVNGYFTARHTATTNADIAGAEETLYKANANGPYGYGASDAKGLGTGFYNIKLEQDFYVESADGTTINGTAGAARLFQINSTSGSGTGGKRNTIVIAEGGKVLTAKDSATTGTDTGYTISLNAWHNVKALLSRETGKLDFYIDDVLVADDYVENGVAHTSFLWLCTGSSYAQANVYFKYPQVTGIAIPAISADLASGQVVVPYGKIDRTVEIGEDVAVIGRKADGKVDVVKYAFNGTDFNQTLPSAPYEKVFVWTWEDLKPLCDVID